MSKPDLSSRRSKLSPAKLALLEKRLRGAEHSSYQPAIPRRSPEDRAQLSFAQQRLWFLCQLEPDSFFYNCPTAVRLYGKLNPHVLETAINEVVRRHEALRSFFPEENGAPAQNVSESLLISAPLINLTDLGHECREAEARRIAIEEAQQSFDIGRGPLMRARIIIVGEMDHVLLFTIHHIVCDEWSMSVLMREVTEIYSAVMEGRKHTLDELPIQYSDYAAWQRKHLQGAVLEEQLSFWKRHLDGAPAELNLPTDRPRPRAQSFRGAHQDCPLSPDLYNSFRSLSLRENVTLFMGLLSGYVTLLYCLSGQEDIVIGTPITGRRHTETEGLVGLFVNTLALRISVSGDPGFRELLGRVREVAIGAYAHQDTPFEKIVEVIHPDRSLGRNPLFQVWFFFQNVSRTAYSLPGISVEPLDTNSGLSRFDISLGLYEVGEGITGGFEYNSDLFEPSTMARLARQFGMILKRVSADPHTRLSELKAMFDEAESQSQAARITEQKRLMRDKLKSAQRKTTTISLSTDTKQ